MSVGVAVLSGPLAPKSAEAGLGLFRPRGPVVAVAAVPVNVPIVGTTASVAYVQPASYVIVAPSVATPGVTVAPARVSGPMSAGAQAVSSEEAALLADRYRTLSARLAGVEARPSSVAGSLAGGLALGLIKAIVKQAIVANPPGCNPRELARSIFRGVIGTEADQPGATREEIEAFIRSIVQENAGAAAPTLGPGAGTYSFRGTITLGERLPESGAPTTSMNAHGLIEPSAFGPRGPAPPK